MRGTMFRLDFTWRGTVSICEYTVRGCGEEHWANEMLFPCTEWSNSTIPREGKLSNNSMRPSARPVSSWAVTITHTAASGEVVVGSDDDDKREDQGQVHEIE